MDSRCSIVDERSHAFLVLLSSDFLDSSPSTRNGSDSLAQFHVSKVINSEQSSKKGLRKSAMILAIFLTLFWKEFCLD